MSLPVKQNTALVSALEDLPSSQIGTEHSKKKYAQYKYNQIWV